MVLHPAQNLRLHSIAYAYKYAMALLIYTQSKIDKRIQMHQPHSQTKAKYLIVDQYQI